MTLCAAGGPDALVMIGSGLVGVGVGASVAPALFTTGFSLRAGQLQRVFAMLELLRGAAAFAGGPNQNGRAAQAAPEAQHVEALARALQASPGER